MKSRPLLSKKLTEYLVVFLACCTGVVGFSAYENSLFFDTVHLALLLVFGLPLIFFSILLLNRNGHFRIVEKVPSYERIIELPFTSSNISVVFYSSSTICAFGILLCLLEKESIDKGVMMFLVGLISFTLAAISYDHPKIWFADSTNMQEQMEKLEKIPKENFPAYQDGIFSYDNQGFTIAIDKDETRILWTEVEKILAYKVDQMIYDCIVIEINAHGMSHRINDQTVGHMKFMEKANEHLDNFKSDWFVEVAFPAFEQKLTLIYEKSENK